MVKRVYFLAAILACAGLAVGAPAAAAKPRPVVLLLHAGGFVFDVQSMPYPQEVAERFGFRAEFVDYPAADLPGAVRAARHAAREAGRDGAPVYAYGESAGGLLAALLAQEDRVTAASTYCPIADMVQYARGFEDPEWYQRYIHASDRDLRGYSPNRRDSERPIFAMRAINDAPSFSGAIREWDLSDEDVSGLVVPGKHMGNPRKPPIYRANARRGLRWLARRAGLPAA